MKDSTPRAYENLVDRLLASPRYGERWARHWMDVLYHGESHGYDKDKPYTRFVQEQIVGDVMFPVEPEALVATGFPAAGP